MKVKDLKENEVIHCKTKEQFGKIIALNPKNHCVADAWNYEELNTCYYPKGYNNTGSHDSIEYYRNSGYTIYQAEQFLDF